MEHYDTDKKYPVFGFGARLKDTTVTNHNIHCFPLNDGSEVDGVEGILEVL
jgi:hypothetical protein